MHDTQAKPPAAGQADESFESLSNGYPEEHKPHVQGPILETTASETTRTQEIVADTMTGEFQVVEGTKQGPRTAIAERKHAGWEMGEMDEDEDLEYEPSYDETHDETPADLDEPAEPDDSSPQKEPSWEDDDEETYDDEPDGETEEHEDTENEDTW